MSVALLGLGLLAGLLVGLVVGYRWGVESAERAAWNAWWDNSIYRRVHNPVPQVSGIDVPVVPRINLSTSDRIEKVDVWPGGGEEAS